MSDGPTMRFMKVELVCPNCGSFWKAPTAIIRKPNGTWDSKHPRNGVCQLCGEPGEPSGDGILSMADAMEAIDES